MIMPKAPITAKDREQTVPEGRTNIIIAQWSYLRKRERQTGGGGWGERKYQENLSHVREILGMYHKYKRSLQSIKPHPQTHTGPIGSAILLHKPHPFLEISFKTFTSSCLIPPRSQNPFPQPNTEKSMLSEKLSLGVMLTSNISPLERIPTWNTHEHTHRSSFAFANRVKMKRRKSLLDTVNCSRPAAAQIPDREME